MCNSMLWSAGVEGLSKYSGGIYSLLKIVMIAATHLHNIQELVLEVDWESEVQSSPS